MRLPFLTQARAPLTLPWVALDEQGTRQAIEIPAERALTVFVDKHELVTLMTLGVSPEWLVLGYLRNQRLVRSAAEVHSITVDWEAGEGVELGLPAGGVAAVKTHEGVHDWAARTQRRVVTTGCGQGTVLGRLLTDLADVRLPSATDAGLTVAQLHAVVNTVRLAETTYKSAGSVHACALFAVPSDGAAPALLTMVEDVGRHNALDTIAGWWWMQPNRPIGSDAAMLLYTTGRLTSEMVIKAAQMGVPLVVSRSGITQMGAEAAQALGVCAVGRAVNRRFLCYTLPQRLRGLT